ncbi:MAG TPA: hypothetical protein VF385_02365 [Patescibacteria group bacterium]
MKKQIDFLIKEALSPIWVSVSEAANLGGVQNKTIRRALKTSTELKFKIVKNRYQIEFGSLILFLHRNTKLKNKLKEYGLGQYINEWKV